MSKLSFAKSIDFINSNIVEIDKIVNKNFQLSALALKLKKI